MSEHKLRTRTICLSRKTFKPVYIEDALDWKIYRAAQTPGPGAHMLINARWNLQSVSEFLRHIYVFINNRGVSCRRIWLPRSVSNQRGQMGQRNAAGIFGSRRNARQRNAWPRRL
jgi:hypothetical protein